MTTYFLISLLGFALLYLGAEWLVKGSSSFARSFGISPIVIGLTVVAFGTSAPELVVSLVSSIKGKSMIAVGNVVGSNICNIALVLGMTALFQPVTGSRSVFRRDIPIMLIISLYLLALSFDSEISRTEGIALFSGIILYTFFNYYSSKRGHREITEHDGPDEVGHFTSRAKQVLFIVTGITGVVVGAELVVNSAEKIMQLLGVSEKFIGLTIVAFGTSLPELATSVVAALRKEMDISIGNLVGSNVFNIMSVLGISAIVRPIAIPGGFVESGLFYDYLVMLFVSFMPWILMKKNSTVSRRGGFVLLCCYAGYLGYLVMKI